MGGSLENFSVYFLTGLPLALSYLSRLALRLVPLLIAAVFLAELARQRLGEERLRRLLSGSGPWSGRLRAAALGAALPFCECGAFPVMLGLLRAGVPLGPVLTFFIISPVVSVPAFLILLSLFGPYLAVAYLVLAVASGMTAGFLLELAGRRWGVFREGIAVGPALQVASTGPILFPMAAGAESKEREATLFPLILEGELASRLGSCGQPVKPAAAACCGGAPDSAPVTAVRPVSANLAGQAWQAWGETCTMLRRILPYAIVAMVLASALHTYIPSALMARVLATGGALSVPLAALAGIPLYAGDCAMIAIVAPFIRATGALGPGIAFIISGTGTSINGIVFMSAVFRRFFLALYVAAVFLAALLCGFALSAIF